MYLLQNHPLWVFYFGTLLVIWPCGKHKDIYGSEYKGSTSPKEQCDILHGSLCFFHSTRFISDLPLTQAIRIVKAPDVLRSGAFLCTHK